MNHAGEKFCKEQESKLPKGFSPTDSQIRERCLRLGREVKLFDAEVPGIGSYQITEDLFRIARATLIEDHLKRSVL